MFVDLEVGGVRWDPTHCDSMIFVKVGELTNGASSIGNLNRAFSASAPEYRPKGSGIVCKDKQSASVSRAGEHLRVLSRCDPSFSFFLSFPGQDSNPRPCSSHVPVMCHLPCGLHKAFVRFRHVPCGLHNASALLLPPLLLNDWTFFPFASLMFYDLLQCSVIAD